MNIFTFVDGWVLTWCANKSIREAPLRHYWVYGFDSRENKPFEGLFTAHSADEIKRYFARWWVRGWLTHEPRDLGLADPRAMAAEKKKKSQDKV